MCLLCCQFFLQPLNFYCIHALVSGVKCLLLDNYSLWDWCPHYRTLVVGRLSDLPTGILFAGMRWRVLLSDMISGSQCVSCRSRYIYPYSACASVRYFASLVFFGSRLRCTSIICTCDEPRYSVIYQWDNRFSTPLSLFCQQYRRCNAVNRMWFCCNGYINGLVLQLSRLHCLHTRIFLWQFIGNRHAPGNASPSAQRDAGRSFHSAVEFNAYYRLTVHWPVSTAVHFSGTGIARKHAELANLRSARDLIEISERDDETRVIKFSYTWNRLCLYGS